MTILLPWLCPKTAGRRAGAPVVELRLDHSTEEPRGTQRPWGIGGLLETAAGSEESDLQRSEPKHTQGVIRTWHFGGCGERGRDWDSPAGPVGHLTTFPYDMPPLMLL